MINYIYDRIGHIASFSALMCMAYILMNPLYQRGCEAYFLVPCFYSIMAFLCRDIFKYHEGAFGLKCFYIVSFVRYAILPAYACHVGISGPYADSSPAAFRYAIFVTILEIIVAFSVIRKYYPTEYQRQLKKSIQQNTFRYNGLGIGGMIFLTLLTGMLILRGHLGEIFSLVRFFVVSEVFDKEADFWTYDIWAIQLLFAFIVIAATSYFQKREQKQASHYNVILPLICVLISCTTILTNNRMTMVYYALCGLCVLNFAFPKYKKALSSILIGTLLTVIVSFTLIKNWGIDVNDTSGKSVSNKEGVSALSDYVCGIDNIAHSYMMYRIHCSEFSANNIAATAIRFFMPARLPGLMPTEYKDVPTTVDLATTGSEMVSVAGETLFWGSEYLGWLFDILAVFAIVRLLIFFDIKTKLECDMGKKYIYSWLSILYGIFMCYCIQTLWNATTYIPLYLTIALWINNTFRLKPEQLTTSDSCNEI